MIYLSPKKLFSEVVDMELISGTILTVYGALVLVCVALGIKDSSRRTER